MKRYRKARRYDHDSRRKGKLRRIDERHGDEGVLTRRCSRKAAYATRTLARDAAIRAAKASGEEINSYKCSEGGRRHWHIGHPTGAGFRKALARGEVSE